MALERVALRPNVLRNTHDETARAQAMSPSTAANDPPLLARLEDGVMWLTLNRPQRLNALDLCLRDCITQALSAASDDAATRVVVLTGSGDRAFCAGQDLHESQNVTAPEGAHWIASWRALFEAFLSCRKPLIAALNGVTAGGGLEMALFCDLRIAVPTARLIMAEVDVGLPAMTGSAWLARHVFDSRMLEIVLCARTVLATEAADIGLVHALAPPTQLIRHTTQRAQALAAKPQHALNATVNQIRNVRRQELTQMDLLGAMERYQREAMESGEPQRIMAHFLLERAKRTTRDPA